MSYDMLCVHHAAQPYHKNSSYFSVFCGSIKSKKKKQQSKQWFACFFQVVSL